MTTLYLSHQWLTISPETNNNHSIVNELDDMSQYYDNQLSAVYSQLSGAPHLTSLRHTSYGAQRRKEQGVIQEYISWRGKLVLWSSTAPPTSTTNLVCGLSFSRSFELAPVVRDVFNTSLVEGVVSCAWKQSIAVPVPKVNPPKVLEENLRPISLTALLAKIMEGLTHDSLARQVLGQLDVKQFCVKEKCTTHALVYLFHSILQFLDRENTSIRIFFGDFSKGFDLVHHNVFWKSCTFSMYTRPLLDG